MDITNQNNYTYKYQGRINPLWGRIHFLLTGPPPSQIRNRAHKKYKTINKTKLNTVKSRLSALHLSELLDYPDRICKPFYFKNVYIDNNF